MLHPFHGYLFGGPTPASSAVTAARARGIREEARRYQPVDVVHRAVADGLLTTSARARLYRYRMEDRSGRVVSGLVGEVPVSALLPHEGTQDTEVVPAPSVEIRPILVVTSAATPDLPTAGEPVVVTEAGRRHEATALRAWAGAFEGGSLVIADGHHRVRAVTETRGPDARVLAVVVGESGGGLTVGTFHRRFDDVAGLPASVSEAFDIEPTQRRGPVKGSLLWVQGTGERLLLRPRPEAVDAVPEPLRDSAAAVAAAALYPRLGFDEAEGRHTATARAAVHSLTRHQAALLIPPAPMSAVLAAALAGTPFPPKTTRFSPKPVRGLILRLAEIV